MNVRNGILIALGGAIVGGALGLLLAPESGKKTRAVVRDKTVKYTHDIADFAGKRSRGVADKAKGYVNKVRGAVEEKADEAGVPGAGELARS